MKSLLIVNVIDQTLCLNDLLHKWRKCLTFVLRSFCLVVDYTGIKIDLYLIACFKSQYGVTPSRFRRLYTGISEIS